MRVVENIRIKILCHPERGRRILNKISKRIHPLVILSLLFLLFGLSERGISQEIRSKVNEGNTKYHEEKYAYYSHPSH